MPADSLIVIRIQRQKAMTEWFHLSHHVGALLPGLNDDGSQLTMMKKQVNSLIIALDSLDLLSKFIDFLFLIRV